MPKDPRRELDLLRDDTGPLGFLLWRIISDVLLWTACPPENRAGLFRDAPANRGEPLAYTTLSATELREHLQTLLTVSATPELANASAVAEACAQVVEWAERHDMKETAVQFAEAAARLEPEVSRRAFTPGRLCRRLGAHHRSAMWYWRAARLARRAHKLGVKGSEIDFANAHLGLGNLELGTGHFIAAERHYWKVIRAALRVGRQSLAGAGHHALIHLTTTTHRIAEAQNHARLAVSMYPAGHPRFPALAHDVAFLWMWQGYFSSALVIFEKILPWAERQPERILALASLARCAAAVKDHIRYERAAAQVLTLAAVGNEFSDTSIYHLAEGARSFWDWSRAEFLASRALTLAQNSNNQPLVALSRSTLEAVALKKPGDIDIVPPVGSEIDEVASAILQKLRKQPAPEEVSGAVVPERYPTI
jgi:tetratricopeptide (TPR) repeat protein